MPVHISIYYSLLYVKELFLIEDYMKMLLFHLFALVYFIHYYIVNPVCPVIIAGFELGTDTDHQESVLSLHISLN